MCIQKPYYECKNKEEDEAILIPPPNKKWKKRFASRMQAQQSSIHYIHNPVHSYAHYMVRGNSCTPRQTDKRELRVIYSPPLSIPNPVTTVFRSKV